MFTWSWAGSIKTFRSSFGCSKYLLPKFLLRKSHSWFNSGSVNLQATTDFSVQIPHVHLTQLDMDNYRMVKRNDTEHLKQTKTMDSTCLASYLKPVQYTPVCAVCCQHSAGANKTVSSSTFWPVLSKTSKSMIYTKRGFRFKLNKIWK